MTERIRLGFAITDAKQPGASTTAARYRVLSDTGTFCEGAVATEEMAMILMSVISGKQLPQQIPVESLGSRKAPSATTRAKKEIDLCRERCFLLTETFDV